MVCPFLEKHKVKKLEFLCITHSHGDHNGDTISILEKYKVDIIIMKEFYRKWSLDGNQIMYQKIVEKAVEKEIKILGISFESLGSEEYSPSQTDETFKNKIKNAKQENFEYFNENNIYFQFGSAEIKIMNWQIFDTEGNLFITGKNKKDGKKVYRDIYEGENENSLGILLIQGNKKAFFSGDMNNIEKNVGGKKIGDEDRLKYEIGKIDFLKFGHHGYDSSNTQDYLNVISPNFGVITNDIGVTGSPSFNYIEKSKCNYLYSTQDEYEVCATIYNDEVTLGFGTSGIKKLKDEIFYIPENKIYSDYLKSKCKIKYEFVEKTVNNWEELKETIEQFKSSGGIYINDNCYLEECLKIYLNDKNYNNIYNANCTININNYQNIHLISKKNEIILKRDKTLIEFPLFKVENGFLTLGEENMEGKIKIDGNKDNVTATSHLIQLDNSVFTMYDNTFICNNLYKLTKQALDYLEYGSAILAIKFSIINMYGGEISNNIKEIFIDKSMDSSILPQITSTSYSWDARGVAITMRCSTLNFFGGKICNNKSINNSEIYSNENSTNGGYLYQLCLGTAIYTEFFSKVNLYKGEISDNLAINNAKTYLITPKDELKTNLNEINSCIYGPGIYCINSEFGMYNDFLISNNSSYLNTTITIGKNCLVGSLSSAIRGSQIYLNRTNSSIEPDENGNVKKISSNTLGGAIDFYGCQEIEINNLIVNKCNADTGGAFCFDTNSKGSISNSELSYNSAISGGAIFMVNSCSLLLNNIKILNNSATEGNGGGICTEGELTINGEKSSISNNEANKYGGGIFANNKVTTINNGIICNNKALIKSGGGIYVSGNGELILNNAKIYKNWCKEYGGGINYMSAKEFTYDKDKIDNMVYNNKAEKNGNDIFPLNNA